MNAISKTAVAIAVLFGIAYGGSKVVIHSRTDSSTTTIDTNQAELIKRGEYVAHTADCYACHTAPGGQAMAGGLSMQTPLGAIYSTNITPDKETGIGNYSYTDFKNAVQHGVRADGTPLYPAMPYPSYVIMPEEDMQALYAYFMNGVAPVKQANADSTLPPVANWRWPLAYWQFLFAPAREFTEIPNASQEINRGKYLVEGPGHCGACHTPRGIAYQEKALEDDGKLYLSGAVIDGWRAKSLRGEDRGLGKWSVEELNEFFSSGRTNITAAFGAMADVVEHSTQHMTAADINAMSTYLKSLSPSPDKNEKLAAKEDTTTADLLAGKYTSRGAVLYNEYCLVCHRSDGNGMPRIFPALNNNSAVTANNPSSTIQITLEGGKMALTSHDSHAFVMPGFKQLSDADIAEVLTFVRNSWNNQAPAVTPQEVAHIRHFVNGKAPNIGANGKPLTGEEHE